MKFNTKGFLFTIFITIVLLSGCGSKSENYDPAPAPMPTPSSPAESPREVPRFDSDEQVSNESILLSTDRKIIHTKNILMETLDFDAAREDVNMLVNQYAGYIENADITGTGINNRFNGNRSAYYKFRIPTERMTLFVEDLMALGNVTQENSSAEDVTLQYFDLDARIKSLVIKEERLLNLLEQGTELKDIIELEKSLADTRYEIESYISRLSRLENQVSFGTVTLNLREVIEITEIKDPPKTFREKVSSGFIDSVETVKNIIVETVIFIIVILPYVIVLGILLLIYLIVKKYYKAKSKTGSTKEINKKEDK
ncbi:uncharacterized protein DUF4349 [Natranaerovirga pectinivora]|uniref:Uncharacterized protein DUF4349 n=1 Tax=Natranaerovirga pectinivora TaxID=682400 RepID=A0A4V2V0J4_9FIRM|nr:DUF4349 domain-containing protein [Natranaerovirga pectinivora]TCT16317.1 uncharacterized protein DUF4349 [Natranaerovirga pectinivora]